jgi:hypothetical protein
VVGGKGVDLAVSRIHPFRDQLPKTRPWTTIPKEGTQVLMLQNRKSRRTEFGDWSTIDGEVAEG